MVVRSGSTSEDDVVDLESEVCDDDGDDRFYCSPIKRRKHFAKHFEKNVYLEEQESYANPSCLATSTLSLSHRICTLLNPP